MKFFQYTLGAAVLLATTVFTLPAQGDQVLATVAGKYPITLGDLQRTIGSSPFATQFNAMDRDDQAALRGNFLKRLVNARLLLLEAQRLELDKDPAFADDLAKLRRGLLLREYQQQLRRQVTVPESTVEAMEQQLGDDPDALEASIAAWRADAYKELKLQRLLELRDQYRVVIHEDRLLPGQTADTVLAEGDGIRILYGDLERDADGAPITNPDWLRRRLVERLEQDLMVLAVENAGIDVETQLAVYRDERLPALLLERKEAEWAGDEQVLKAWFAEHPEVGIVPERRHIGQLVAADRDQAEAFRERILAGESLFELAGAHSIDPYGKEHKGDMGWLKQGSGLPLIEAAIAGLEDGQVSEVIETPKGFHLVVIIERRPGGTRAFPAVRDRVRRMVIMEHLAPYLRELEARYGVDWPVLGPTSAQTE